MIWTAIEAAAKLIEKQVPAPLGPLLGKFIRVLGQHLKKKHGKQVEAGAPPAKMAAYLLASAECAVRRILMGEDVCSHKKGPGGLD